MTIRACRDERPTKYTREHLAFSISGRYRTTDFACPA